MEFPNFLTIAGSWFTMIGGIWVLFERAESVSSERARAAVSTWLKNLPSREIKADWPATFAYVFDQVFGERLLSLKCFLRSSLASLVAVTIYSLLAYPSVLPRTVFIPIALLALIPNYLSLLETRIVLHWIDRAPSLRRNLLGLMIDALATLVIAVGSAFLSDEFWVAITARTGLVYSGMAMMFISSSFLIASVLFTSLWASIWLWLYALSGLALKILRPLGLFADRLTWVLDIDNKPIKSLGFVSMMLVTIGYFFGALVFLVA